MGVLIDTDILSRVIRIRYGNNIGTAFVLGAANQLRVLVTARHLVRDAAAGDRIALRHKEDWGYLTVAHIAHAPCGADVCVIVPSTQWGEGLPYEILNAEMLFGEDIAFCGFPLGLEMKGLIEPAYPLALIKAGIFSGQIEVDGSTICLFDAINNVGFSGGPIVRHNPKDRKNYIVGMASGYKYDAPTPVLSKDEQGEEVSSPDHYVRANSGFMYGVPANIIHPLVVGVALDALQRRDTNGLAIAKSVE